VYWCSRRDPGHWSLYVPPPLPTGYATKQTTCAAAA
jgi:hypothetical protein